MLNENEFVQRSLDANLFYLRTLREFCLNVQLSFLENNKVYIEEAESIALSCENLGVELATLADGRLSQEALDAEIFVTPYTLKCEELTEKLFDVKINTDITKQEMNFRSGNPTTASKELVATIERINAEARNLTNRFVTLCETIHEKLLANESFSYSYPSLYQFMIYEMNTYSATLVRLEKREYVDPTTAINNEYIYNLTMKIITLFIAKLVDPQNTEIYEGAAAFYKIFMDREVVYKTTPLTPSNQNKLSTEEIRIVTELQTFVKGCIEDLLNKKAYFIIEPIFLDNMYTEINYFLFLLKSRQ